MGLRLIHRLEENILAILLVFMTFLVFAEVVMRFVFNAGIAWAQEVTLYTAAWFVLFGASYGVKVGAHIGVDVVVKLLPAPMRSWVTLAALAICLVYCALFLLGAYDYISLMYEIGIEMEDVALPKWMALMILPIGFILLVVRFLELAWKVWRGETEGFHLADEGEESMQLAQELQAQQASDISQKIADDVAKDPQEPKS